MSSSPQAEIDATKAPRASGRVRKAPETMYATSPFANGKRKRDADVDGDRAMPEDYVSEEDEVSEEEEADEEELREKRAKARKQKKSTAKKPAQKKAKTIATTALPLRTTGGKKRAPKTAKALAGTDAREAGGLYAEVFASGRKMEDVAATWLAQFQEHEAHAMGDVINFILKCAGCDSKVTDHDIEDPDGATNKLEEIQEEYQASNPTDYPLIAKGKGAAAFKDSVSSFLQTLLKTLHAANLLFENSELLENVQVWTSAMSSAANRGFRHTATVVSLSIITGLCHLARERTDDAATIQQHADSEAKKKTVNKARVKDFQQKAHDAGLLQEFYEALIKDWFETVFIHRYRDIDPAIRRDCMAALGDWIMILPAVFFDGTHLRYMGWVLSDASHLTRAEVVKQLQRIYKDSEKLAGLKTFTERFRTRIVEIATSDSESNVRASGVELLDLLRENGLIEPDDIDAVGRLIFDSDVKVRKAVAGFFAESIKDTYNGKLDDLGGEEALREALPEVGEDNYETPQMDWLSFKCLAEMLQSYDGEEALPHQIERTRGDPSFALHATGLESRFTLAADSLYNYVDEVKEWQVLAGYLLFDHSLARSNGVSNDTFSMFKHECVLTEKEESVLLEVLSASVKRTLTDFADKAASSKSKLSKKQKAQLQEEQEESARHLAALIPKLLKKFGDTPSSAGAVLRLENTLNLPSLEELHQDATAYGTLLDHIKQQFISHSTDEVLGPASGAILHAKSYGELDDLTEEKLTSLWEDVVNNLAELLEAPNVAVRGSLETDALIALSNNLLRVIRLSSVCDCTSALNDPAISASDKSTDTTYTGGIEFTVGLIRRAIPTDTTLDHSDTALEDEIARRASEAALFYFRWQLKSIIDRVQTGTTDIAESEIETLAGRRDAYVANLTSALESRKSQDDVCSALAGNLLELYSSAAILRDLQPKEGMSDDYTVLTMAFEPPTVKLLIKVFAATEKKYAALSGKKLEEAPIHTRRGKNKANGSDAEDAAEEEEEEDIHADPFDSSDNESASEDDEPTQQATQTSQSQGAAGRRERKLLQTLLAEEGLCTLTGKFIHAIFADVFTDSEAVKARVRRNTQRLGGNFREVCGFLEQGRFLGGAKGKGKKAKGVSAGDARGKAKAGKRVLAAKSREVVVEDEEDEDEIVDEEEAIVSKELEVDGEGEGEGEGQGQGIDGDGDGDEAMAGVEDAERESVLGD
ncbi:hypothetical protein MBLNU230_g4532t1 [Neophaeotheca triangularis]